MPSMTENPILGITNIFKTLVPFFSKKTNALFKKMTLNKTLRQKKIVIGGHTLNKGPSDEFRISNSMPLVSSKIAYFSFLKLLATMLLLLL